MDTPILFLIFNRPDKTRLVFERIKEVRPTHFFIAADGPRSETEAGICEQTRQLVLSNIDWPCEVHTLLHEKNLGCTPAVVSALDWFFEQVEAGIVLEDDCLPDLSFFDFCTELLKKYAHNDRIKHISGSNFHLGRKFGADSYYFSVISLCWGWATWRRAWQQYRLGRVEEISETAYLETLNYPNFPPKHQIYWKRMFDYHRTGEDTIWDHRWKFNLWYQKGVAITPNQNLVSNIGYGVGATTSSGRNSARNRLANLPVLPMLQINHPSHIQTDSLADALLCDIYNPPLPLGKRIRHEVGKWIPDQIRSGFRRVFPG